MKSTSTQISNEFGKFSSLSDFLDSYRVAQKHQLLGQALSLKPDLASRQLRSKQRRKRNLVEVEATLVELQSDDSGTDGSHHRILINVTAIVVDNANVSADVTDAMATKRKVLVAIRYGDSMGIQEKIDGLTAGAQLKLKGEWIPRDLVQSNGGASMSLLHFTHHPLGFICTPVRCYA